MNWVKVEFGDEVFYARSCSDLIAYYQRKAACKFYGIENNDITFDGAWEQLGGRYSFNRSSQKWEYLDERGLAVEM